jgi:hypothetical protein
MWGEPDGQTDSMVVSRDVALCSVVHTRRNFRGAYRLHQQHHHTNTLYIYIYIYIYIYKANAVPLHVMNELEGRGNIAPLILDLGTRWGWVVSVTPRPRFTPGEMTPGTHCTGGWVGPRAGLDTEVTGKIFSPQPGIEPRSPGRLARSQTLYWLSYPAHHTLNIYT